MVRAPMRTATVDMLGQQDDDRAAEIARLRAEVEQLTVQLAGCATAADGNTAESVAQRAQPGDYGYSGSYAAVCRAVDREIALRAEVEAMREVCEAAVRYARDSDSWLLDASAPADKYKVMLSSHGALLDAARRLAAVREGR